MKEFSLTQYLQLLNDDTSLSARVFFISGEKELTYKDLTLEVAFFFHFLNAQEFKKMAILLSSPYEAFSFLLASLLAQKPAVLLSSKEPAHSVRETQERLGIDLIVDDQLINTIKNQKRKTSTHFQEEIANTASFSLLSSGSSGLTKEVRLSIENVHASATQFINFFQANETDTFCLNLPHHHVGGLMILWRAFFSGAKVSTDTENSFSFISLVPLQLQRKLSAGDTSLLKKARAILIGGAPLSSELKNQAMDLGLKIYETYGMSETASFVMLNGVPMSGQEIKLSEEGLFMIKGPTLSPDAKRDESGFYHTKDLGRKNSDQTFSFIKRTDLLFKSAGELIDPLDVEEALKHHPRISRAVSVPIKHPEWTLAQALIYSSTSDEAINPLELKESLKNKLHPFFIPRYFFQVSQTFFPEGQKPKRFELSLYAQKEYLKTLFHHQLIERPESKELIVFFHGFMEDSEDLESLAEAWPHSRLLFIDLPGHGKTNFDSFKDREFFYQSLKILIEFYQKDSALTFYGYSMGGRVAIELLLRGLECQKLYLESSSLGLKSESEKEARLKSDLILFSQVKQQEDLNSFFEHWYSNPIFANYKKTSDYNLKVVKKVNHNFHQWQKSLEFLSPGASAFLLKDVIENLKKLPIEAIVGEEDKKYLEHYQEINSSLPLLKLHLIKKAGHNPHVTHQREVIQILKQS